MTVKIMDTSFCLIGFFTLLAISGSLGSFNERKLQISSSDLFVGAYADGYRQILSAGLSPKCKETALNDLLAAHEADSQMNCTGFVNNLEDIGDIIDTALNSVGNLVTDLNTVINAVPMCMEGKAWYNLPGKISCVLEKFSAVWQAVKDFWNYKNYVMDTVEVIEDYVNCFKSNKAKVSQNIQVIVETAKLCH